MFVENIFQKVINIFIKENKKKVRFIYKFLFIIFKSFLKNRLILDFKKFKFYSYPDRKDLTRWMLKHLKPWDYEQILRLKDILKESKSLFIDCGSNFGAYSVIISSLCKNTDVLSFDASNKMIGRLKENINLNKLKNIKIFNLGIGKKNSKDYFNDNDSDFLNLGSYKFQKKNNSKLLKVVALDQFLDKFKLSKYKKIVIKIDIEGYEFEALQGLEKIIKLFKPIIFIEMSKMLLEHKNFSQEKFNNFLLKNNLKFLNSNGKEVKLSFLINKLKTLNPKHQTIGDFFLVDKSLNLSFKI